ncbi:hypothetical protein DPMN_101993 [Dreissena polymorpha]|uniref:Uncharacterized protein n=1 Tax=Dreissena polymorpha TaxID=45954 RepID=A0A9D4RAK9_DREPO|nr:hypothetical protein DPMN_101993 [Dreissena polymorpha]
MKTKHTVLFVVVHYTRKHGQTRSHAKGKKHKDKIALVSKVKTKKNLMFDFVKADQPISSRVVVDCQEPGPSELTQVEILIPDPPMSNFQQRNGQDPQATNKKPILSRWTLKKHYLRAETL